MVSNKYISSILNANLNLFVLLLITFITEILVMVFLHSIKGLSTFSFVAIDALIITISVAIPLYFFLYRNKEFLHIERIRKRLKKELETTKGMFESFVDNSADAIFWIDFNGCVLKVNKTFEEMFGWTEDVVIGQLLPTVPKDELNEVQELLNEIKEGKKVNPYDAIRQKADKSFINVNINMSPILDEKGRITAIACITRDITERKERDDLIRHYAYFDYLTGLPNRRQIESFLLQALAKSQIDGTKIGVFFIDLNGFKYVNDTLGHALGDELLKAVATRLGGYVGETSIIGRIGGDEFCFVSTNVNDEAEFGLLAELLINAFTEPWVILEHDFYLSASIGIAVFPEHGEDVETLLKNADLAMFTAKKESKNNYIYFDQILNDKFNNYLELERKLRTALQNQEFTVYYQPQIDTNTGEIVGMEALLRWKTSEGRFISPAEFIPVAEETGLIIPITEWVLAEVARQNRLWQDQGLSKIPIAINISAAQFINGDFAKSLKSIVKETRLETRWLELEITESLTLHDVKEVRNALREIKSSGYIVSIDDFGTGYSSLSYLSDLPIDKLKIDRSFVQGLIENDNKKAIAKTIIILAKSLNIKVLAEGVETLQQMNLLKDMGCNVIQGFLFCKPLPPQEIEKFLIKHTYKNELSCIS